MLMKCKCISHLQLLNSGDEMRELLKNTNNLLSKTYTYHARKILKYELKVLLLHAENDNIIKSRNCDCI